MSTNYAFIGAGNMAKAMIGGILSSGLAAPDCVTASNPSAPKLDALKEEFGIRTMYKKTAVFCEFRSYSPPFPQNKRQNPPANSK